MRISQALKLLPAAGLLLTALIGSTAGAASFTVSNLDDSGPGSLRDAIDFANASVGADTIPFTVSGTIILTNTLPNIISGSAITIDGGNVITVSGNHAVRVMTVDASATLNLRNLTVADGFSEFNNPFVGTPPGGISNSGTLTVTNSTFSGNKGQDTGAGGIENFATGILTITNSTFSHNSSSKGGGGVENEGVLTVIDSTFSSNGSPDGCGGIGNGGTATVTNSTFSGNGGGQGDGGMNNSGTLTVTNSTFSGNNSGVFGAGGINNVGGTLTVTNSTFSGNNGQDGGGGIWNIFGGTVNMTNTILANNTGGDCVNDDGIVNASGVNLVKDGSCDPTAITGDPKLGPLADNGGPTLTHALLAGSPAIDAVTDGSCPPPAADQRGVARPQGAYCDIGAYEFKSPVDACTAGAVLDNFNRHEGPLGRHWRGQADTRFYSIRKQRVDVGLGGLAFWNPDRFGANQAAFVTLSRVDTGRSAQGALLKVQDGRGPHTGRKEHDDGRGHDNGKGHDDDVAFDGAIAVAYDGKAQAVQVSTIHHGKPDWRHYGKTLVAFSDGDKLGACALANGNVRIYKNDVLVTTVALDAKDKAFFNGKGGKVGIWSSSAPRAFLDDFGGGTVAP